jgi:uncharacterized protein (TIGR03085 family)
VDSTVQAPVSLARQADHARLERIALCDLLDGLGPAAPTLCDGWTSLDLAAHLVLRERRLDAWVGIPVRRLARYTESVQRGLAARHPYPHLVRLVRYGPPAWSPLRFVTALDAINLVEFFVHHEDLRRAQPAWRRRALAPEVEAAMWQRLRSAARTLLRRSPVGVMLRWSDAVHLAGNPTRPRVVVSGEPSELLLFAFGRQRCARVGYAGMKHDVAALKEARFGIGSPAGS